MKENLKKQMNECRQHKWVAASCSLLAGLAMAASAIADPVTATNSVQDFANLTLDQLVNIQVDSVYGASKYEQMVTRAPASVSIVTADDINKFGYKTLGDVMRSVNGVYITYERNYQNIGFRGFNRPGDYDTRVLLMIDGHRENDNLYDSAAFGPEFPVDIDLVERVEVIRGPSSSIYGSSAFFGVINVVTRKGGDINGVEASASGGTFDSYKGRVTYGKKFTNDVEVLVSGSYYNSDGNAHLFYPEYNTPQNNHGVADNADAERSENLFGNINYHDFTLSGAFDLREKHIPTASYFTVFNDGREKTVDHVYYVDLKFQHEFDNDLTVMCRAYHDWYRYFADYPYDVAPAGGPALVNLFHDSNWGSGVGTEVQVTKKIADQHTLVMGAEFRDSLELHQNNYTGDTGMDNFLDNRSRNSIGLYSQAEIAIRTNLLLNLGARYDHYSTFGGEFSPRAGLIYSPWTTSTFKLLYGQAYRSPNTYEMFNAAPGFSEANLDLKPETIKTYELVYEQYLANNLKFSASGYYWNISDLISQQFDAATGLLQYRNVNSVEAKGLELAMEKKWTDGSLLRLGYAIQHAEDEQTHLELNNSPRHLAKLNGVLPLYQDKLFGGLEIQYTSSLKTLQGNHTAGFVIANLTLYSQKILKNLEVSASIYNLFDTRYNNPGTTAHLQDMLPQDGRSFRVKATYKF